MFRFLAVVAAVSNAFFAVPASAASAPAIRVDESGFAVQGYDSVAFFTDHKPVKGLNAHQIEWMGVKWRFASARDLSAFKADPEHYAPQFGGYCAWAVSQHYLAPGDPNFWKVVDGKLYLNANARAKELWEADQTDAIKRGHENWPEVLDDNQDSGR